MDRPSSSVFLGDYSDQVTLELNNYFIKVGDDHEYREHNVTGVTEYNTNIKEEMVESEDAKVDLDEHKLSYDWLQNIKTEDIKHVIDDDSISVEKNVKGFEKWNTDYPLSVKIDTEHEFAYKWLKVGKTEDVEEEANIDNEVDFDTRNSEEMTVKLNGSLRQVVHDNKDTEYDMIESIKCDTDINKEEANVDRPLGEANFDRRYSDGSLHKVGHDYKERKYDMVESMKCDIDIKEEKTNREDVMIDMKFPLDRIISSENKHQDGTKFYHCHHCGFKTKRKKYLTTHFKLKHDDNAQRYKCQQCEFKTKRKTLLAQHLEFKHEIVNGEDKLHQCQFCDYKCKFMTVLKKHLKNKHSENVDWHCCQQCDFKTVHKPTLTRHFKVKHDNVWYKCQFCEFHTKHKSYLASHVEFKHDIVSEGDKVQLCHLCDFKSKFKKRLRQHVKSEHCQNVDWHHCQHCEYKTIHKHDLLKHFECKHGSAWYKCQFCDFKTKVKKYLASHIEYRHDIVGGGKVHQCQFCDFRSKIKKRLSRHVKSKHC